MRFEHSALKKQKFAWAPAWLYCIRLILFSKPLCSAHGCRVGERAGLLFSETCAMPKTDWRFACLLFYEIANLSSLQLWLISNRITSWLHAKLGANPTFTVTKQNCWLESRGVVICHRLQPPRDCCRGGRAECTPVGYEWGSLGLPLWLAAGSPTSQPGSLKVLASSLLFLKPWTLTDSTRFHKSKDHVCHTAVCVCDIFWSILLLGNV